MKCPFIALFAVKLKKGSGWDSQRFRKGSVSETNGLPLDWPSFLNDFHRRWPDVTPLCRPTGD